MAAAGSYHAWRAQRRRRRPGRSNQLCPRGGPPGLDQRAAERRSGRPADRPLRRRGQPQRRGRRRRRLRTAVRWCGRCPPVAPDPALGERALGRRGHGPRGRRGLPAPTATRSIGLCHTIVSVNQSDCVTLSPSWACSKQLQDRRRAAAVRPWQRCGWAPRVGPRWVHRRRRSPRPTRPSGRPGRQPRLAVSLAQPIAAGGRPRGRSCEHGRTWSVACSMASSLRPAAAARLRRADSFIPASSALKGCVCTPNPCLNGPVPSRSVTENDSMMVESNTAVEPSKGGSVVSGALSGQTFFTLEPPGRSPGAPPSTPPAVTRTTAAAAAA